jgi:hypothetical protein
VGIVSALDLLLPLPAERDWPTELKAHLSPSQIRMYATCPEQYRKVYVLGERQRPGAALVWGSADHYAHEQNFVQKIESHEDLSEADVTLAFAEGFDQRVEQDGGEAEVEWGDDKPGDLKDRGVALVAAYHRQVSPSVQPVAVERSFQVTLPGVPVPIFGRVDIQTADRVIEGKTAAAKKTKPEPQWRLQGEMYQIESGLPVEWHVKTKAKTPGCYTAETDAGLWLPLNERRTDATIVRVQKLVAQLLAMLDTYGPNEPWPTGAPDYGWSCQFCGWGPTHAGSCAWWAS